MKSQNLGNEGLGHQYLQSEGEVNSLIYVFGADFVKPMLLYTSPLGISQSEWNIGPQGSSFMSLYSSFD